jgi:hypothetical protein
MMVFKRALPRRTFLKGVGATLSLPLLDAMVPALTPQVKTAAAVTPRLGFVYTPNGFIPKYWVPTETGKDFSFTPSLASLEPFRDQVLLTSGLVSRPASGRPGEPPGPHTRACSAWLTGVHIKQTEGGDVESGISADQIAATVLGKDTLLPSLELAIEQNEHTVGNCEAGYSCIYQNSICWRNATTPLPMEIHPRVVFERLFGDGGTPAEQRQQLRTSRSILDAVTGEIGDLEKTLGTTDRGRLAQYLDSIREIETRIDRAGKRTDALASDLPSRPVDIPSEFEDHVKLMFDLQALAYQADITRVITFQISHELTARSYPNLGLTGAHHAISHHVNNPEMMAQKAKIDGYHVKLLAYYAKRLHDTPDGDGSLLDHVVILYGPGFGDSNAHDPLNLPGIVLGTGYGKIKGGRHLGFTRELQVPQANLLVSMLDCVGAPSDHFADSSGPLEGLTGI